MKYIDTAIVVSALVEETTSAVTIAWLRDQPAGSLASSHWMLTELSASLSRKVRTKRITRDEKQSAMLVFLQSIGPSLTMVEIDASVFRRAAEIASYDELGIRGADALHLAASSSAELTLATLDKQFARGAVGLGYAIELVA